MRSRQSFRKYDGKRKCPDPIAFMHIRHLGALVVGLAQALAKGYRCTFVQYPVDFGPLNRTLAYFQKCSRFSRPNMADYAVFDPVKADMSYWGPRLRPGVSPSHGIMVYFGPVPGVLWPTKLNVGLLMPICRKSCRQHQFSTDFVPK